MRGALPFALPALDQGGAAPVWTGTDFVVGDSRCRVLSFKVGESGWSDELTAFHDDTAGADHFIDIASRRHALAAIQRHVAAPTPVILEVGCSSGHFLRLLRTAMPDAV